MATMNLLKKQSREAAHQLNLVSLLASVLSCVSLFATLWTVARKAPLSKGFSSQEYWSELSFPSPGTEPESPVSLALQVDSSPLTPKAILITHTK